MFQTDISQRFDDDNRMKKRNGTHRFELMSSLNSNDENEDDIKRESLVPVAPVSPLDASLPNEHNCAFLRVNEKENVTPRFNIRNEGLHTIFANDQEEKNHNRLIIPPFENGLLCSGERNATPLSSNKTERLHIPLLNDDSENQTNMSLIPSFKQLLRVDFQTTRRFGPNHLKRKEDYGEHNIGYSCARISSNKNKKMKINRISPASSPSPEHFRFDMF
mmetsp:Transcript_5649/g.11830  ORF Transcript_5649/g.11830 Transcript_5649/m.11830 type:complete len:219 (-) Transcript_5649:151-807(-)